MVVRAYKTFIPGCGSSRFEKSVANDTCRCGACRYRYSTTKPGGSASTSCHWTPPLSDAERARSRFRSSASYAGDMLHLVRVPAGIGGKYRSQCASGVARISKFEKYVAPVNTP